MQVMVVGAGVFITIPLMLKELPGPYALLGWLGDAPASAMIVAAALCGGPFAGPRNGSPRVAGSEQKQTTGPRAGRTGRVRA